MGKKSKAIESEPLFSPIKTTDDDDDAEQSAGDGGPTATRYRDDPNNSNGNGTNHKNTDDDGGPPVRYRDEAESSSSVFDWGSGDDSNDGNSPKTEKEKGNNTKKKKENKKESDIYQIDEFDMDANGFAPISLLDSDSEDEENGIRGSGNGNNGNIGDIGRADKDRIRQKANKLLNDRIFDDDDDDTNSDDERIFVGGGWGRHGSQFSCCPRGVCSCCCGGGSGSSEPKYSGMGGGGAKKYSRGPPVKNTRSFFQMVCILMAFVALVFGAGYVGYEAGLPALGGDVDENEVPSVNASVIHQPHTKGEEWLQWLEREKHQIHMPHYNFTLHKKDKNSKGESAFRAPSQFEPMTQQELLKLSENIFQSCSERSLRTAQGREACLSHCHGHYCCFEKDPALGSCVAEANSYCFAYAACENVIADFEMTNVVAKAAETDTVNSHDGMLNLQDVQLLQATCSRDSIKTLEGIRDCTAFCQHHLCCFADLEEEENCAVDHPGECQAYDSCSILVKPHDVHEDDHLVHSEPEAKAVHPEPEARPDTVPNEEEPAALDGRTFKDQCKQSNLEENWEICKNHCSRYKCCFDPDNSCYDQKRLECDEYFICEEFFTFDAPVDTIEDAQGVHAGPHDVKGVYDHNPSNVNHDIETAVHAVCGLEDENPGDDSWVTACHAICANYLCCFTTEGTTSNCRKTYGDDVCAAYQGCVVLHASAAEASPPTTNTVPEMPPNTVPDGSAEMTEEELIDEVKELCTSQAIYDSRLADRCREACRPRWCCFEENEGNCYTMNSEWCDEYMACEVLAGTGL